MKNKTQITDRLLSVVGLFENVLGRFADLIGFNQKKEKYKRILSDVYGYKDIHMTIRPELDEQKVNTFFKTVFTYYDNQADDGAKQSK